jgi:hypothetical protein
MRHLPFAACALVACGGSPLAGTWSSNASPMDLQATFTETTFDFHVIERAQDGSIFSDDTVRGTYTTDLSKTPHTVTFTLQEFSGVYADGSALPQTIMNAGASDESWCLGSLPKSDPVCIASHQSNDFSISGKTLTLGVLMTPFNAKFTLIKQ